jgi:hypothetical protein
MADDLWVVGDVQGFLRPFQRVLHDNQLIDADGRWLAGGATLVVVGDLVDRGPDGIGVIELLMHLQAEARREGGRVNVLIGNHDVLLLAARRFGEPLLTSWLEGGGVPRDLEALTDAHATWLGGLPAMAIEREVLFMHADAMFYLDYGASIAEVNDAFTHILTGHSTEAWQHLLSQFEEHRAFSGADGEAHLNRYLETFGARRLVHGHTPVPRMLQVAAETVTHAYEYGGGRCVNVDPGIYLGGPGFAYRVTIAR